METKTNSEIKSSTSGKLSSYLFLIVSMALGFTIGYYYNIISEFKLSKNKVSAEITKSSVNLAVDEDNNLLMIDKQTGNYTIYQDSVGHSIFNLYARNIFGQHSTTQTNEKTK